MAGNLAPMLRGVDPTRTGSDFFDFSNSLLDILKTDDNLLDFEGLAEMLEIDMQQGGVPNVQPPYVLAQQGQQGHPPEHFFQQLQAAAAVPAGPPLQAQPAPPSTSVSAHARSKSSEGHSSDQTAHDNEGSDEEDGNTTAGGRRGQKKKRTRNSEQMALNRVAQQKYRERKKSENDSLHAALEQLTTQLAALKAIEVRNAELENSNQSLMLQASQQHNHIQRLEGQVQQQAGALKQQGTALTHSQTLVSQQQVMILDMHAKLRLQEQIIGSLKDQLKESIDKALSNVDTGNMCSRLIAAVKASLYGAKDVEGLQELLEKLPDDLVVELCKTIFHACKDMWPELMSKCAALPCAKAQAMYLHYMNLQTPSGGPALTSSAGDT